MPYMNKVSGVIVGIAARPQPGWTNEEVPADHADITSYKAAKDARRAAGRGVNLVDLIEVLAKKDPNLKTELAEEVSKPRGGER